MLLTPTHASTSFTNTIISWINTAYNTRNINTNTNTNADNNTTTTWRGETTPFSEYAEHVQVSQEDLPMSIASAIIRSMRTVGSRFLPHRLLIVDDDEKGNNVNDNDIPTINQQDCQYQTTTTTTTMIIASQLKDHPPD